MTASCSCSSFPKPTCSSQLGRTRK
uniref:Uncharacterized protein n=1 Tax=Anguilla anguilla TaxID=7936 RepID=A0A0E9UHM6_ANGAN